MLQFWHNAPILAPCSQSRTLLQLKHHTPLLTFDLAAQLPPLCPGIPLIIFTSRDLIRPIIASPLYIDILIQGLLVR